MLSKIKWTYIVLDLITWGISSVIVFIWRSLKPNEAFLKYSVYLGSMILLWILLSAIFQRYKAKRIEKYFAHNLRLTLLYITSCVITYYVHQLEYTSTSFVILASIITLFYTLTIFWGSIYYAYRYAVAMDYNATNSSYENRNAKTVLAPRVAVSEKQKVVREESIRDLLGDDGLKIIKNWLDLESSNTYISATTTLFNIQQLEDYRYDQIANILRLNDIRGINKLFCTINEKLPDNGLFVCCITPKRLIKESIFNKYPWGINYVAYFFHFIKKRILPKLTITKRIYYDVTKGKNRVLSITETIGRLYYCGFEVVDRKTNDCTEFVLARRIKQPEVQVPKNYGPLIKLNRMGKNKTFAVYKMRTMHPYSEYMQAYLYEQNNLDEGGKLKDDIRVTTFGKFMRKYWLDELPMFINFFKGEMKLVGVRPLSAHYFSLYSKELQELRVQFKPGLLPPFYADMPKTLDEIQESEMKYLLACKKNGTFSTDCKYLFKILNSIFLKKARSK